MCTLYQFPVLQFSFFCGKCIHSSGRLKSLLACNSVTSAVWVGGGGHQLRGKFITGLAQLSFVLFKHTTEITALQDNQPVSHSISLIDLGCYFHIILTFLYILISEIASVSRFHLQSIDIHKSKRLSGNSFSHITFSTFLFSPRR